MTLITGSVKRLDCFRSVGRLCAQKSLQCFMLMTGVFIVSISWKDRCSNGT